MSDTAQFKVFCLERYKSEHKMKGSDAIQLFQKHGVLDYLGTFYDTLHTFGEQYLVQDITQFIEKGENHQNRFTSA